MSDIAYAIKINGCWAKYAGNDRYLIDPNWFGRSESANRAFVVDELRKLRTAGYEVRLVRITRSASRNVIDSEAVATLLRIERKTALDEAEAICRNKASQWDHSPMRSESMEWCAYDIAKLRSKV